MVLGGITGEFCVRTLPKDACQKIGENVTKRQSREDTKNKEGLYVDLCRQESQSGQIYSPAITGDTDVWGLRPLLLTVFVMMNLIGAAEDVGVFLEICGDIQKARTVICNECE